jgi:hypothetical protein
VGVGVGVGGVVVGVGVEDYLLQMLETPLFQKLFTNVKKINVF